MSDTFRFTLEQFEGPLDLLLKLIEDEKLDITTISLAKVTDQYLSYIQHEDRLPADEIADFLVVAARLIYLKSKYLLPSFALEDEDGVDLEKQLKIYREYYVASKTILKLIGKRRFSYVRNVPLRLAREKKFSPPLHLKIGDLAEAFRLVLGKLDAVIRLPKMLLKATVSIREKIRALKNAIERGMLTFHRFYDPANKQDIIVSFLALLELVKTREIEVAQEKMFSDILITKR